MGNYFFGNPEKDDESLSLEINLPKSCYYPGEKLTGEIILQAKSTKVPSIFNFYNSILLLIQHQKYQFFNEDIQINKEEKKPIFFRRHNFKKYKNRDILTPLKISFSIKIPNNAYPTLLHTESNFIRHYLEIKFPKIKRKKSVGIIIQNIKKMTVENKLYKSPYEKFKDCIKTCMFKKTSKLAILLKTEKNTYSYNELIPYEIVINYSESDIFIKNIRINLTRNVYINSDDYVDIKVITYKDYNMPKKLKDNVFQIGGYFTLPTISDYFSVNPISVYNFYNFRIIDNIKKTLDSIYLYPTCFSPFLNCYYNLNLEINFNSFIYKNEYIYLPIELYTPLKIVEDNKKDNVIEEKDDNNIENEIIDDKFEINNIETKKDSEDDNNDFEIINKLDFYKVLSEEK